MTLILAITAAVSISILICMCIRNKCKKKGPAIFKDGQRVSEVDQTPNKIPSGLDTAAGLDTLQASSRNGSHRSN